MNTIDRAKRLIEERKRIEISFETVQKQLKDAEQELGYIEQASVLASETAKKLQENVKVSVTALVDFALANVFENGYKFDLKFEDKYNKSVVRPVLVRDGKEYDPMKDNGGGIIDLVAMVLRLSFWALKGNLRNVMIFDEPFKFLSIDAQDKMGEFLRDIARKMKMQFIIVSHSLIVTEYADRVFQVFQKKKVSKAIMKGE